MNSLGRMSLRIGIGTFVLLTSVAPCFFPAILRGRCERHLARAESVVVETHENQIEYSLIGTKEPETPEDRELEKKELEPSIARASVRLDDILGLMIRNPKEAVAIVLIEKDMEMLKEAIREHKQDIDGLDAKIDSARTLSITLFGIVIMIAFGLFAFTLNVMGLLKRKDSGTTGKSQKKDFEKGDGT